MWIVHFFRNQNWYYAIPCLLLLWAMLFLPLNLWQSFSAAALFLILYSLKYAHKTENKWPDLIKLIFYFVFLTCYLLAQKGYLGRYDIHTGEFFIILFCMYFYTSIVAYYLDMTSSGHNIKKSYWLITFTIQTIVLAGIMIWAITQKMEADKQKDIARYIDAYAKKNEYANKDNEKLLVELKAMYDAEQLKVAKAKDSIAILNELLKLRK